MNRLFFSLMFCFLYSQAIYDIQVHNSSKLVIRGESNVTEFSCLFEHDISDHKHIVTSEIAEGLILLENADLKVPIDRFDCGIFLMNQDFRKALGGKKYPFVNIHIDRFKINYDELNEIKSITSSIEIEIRDVKRRFEIEFSYKTIADKFFVVTGKQKMFMKDFQIKPPEAIGGLIYACDEIEIVFNLVLKILPYTKKG